MKFLIRLNVLYEMSTDAVQPFIMAEDKRLWKTFLADLNYETYLCRNEGHIYFLIRDCNDQDKIEKGFGALPLVKEGFFDLTIFHFDGFENLNFFSDMI